MNCFPNAKLAQIVDDLSRIDYRYKVLGRRIFNVSEAKPNPRRESKVVFGGSVIEVRMDNVLGEILVYITKLKGKFVKMTPCSEESPLSRPSAK